MFGLTQYQLSLGSFLLAIPGALWETLKVFSWTKSKVGKHKRGSPKEGWLNRHPRLLICSNFVTVVLIVTGLWFLPHQPKTASEAPLSTKPVPTNSIPNTPPSDLASVKAEKQQGTVATKAQGDIAWKIIEQFSREHGGCPSVDYVNDQLRTAHESFSVTKLKCPQPNTPGAFIGLDAQGRVEDFSLDKLTVEGSPAPNSQMTIVKVGPAGSGKIHIGEVRVLQSQSTPMAAAASDTNADVLSQIAALDAEMSEWKQTTQRDMPTAISAADYQEEKMREFHRLFADRLMLLVRQLRKCGTEDNRRLAQAIYDREKDAIPVFEAIDSDILGLNEIGRGLKGLDGAALGECVNK